MRLFFRNVSLAILTAILLILVFPNPQISILAWIAFIPIFYVIDNSSKAKSFFLSYLAGLLFFGGTIYWLTHVTKLGYLVLIFSLALFFGIFGFLANIFLRKSGFSFLAFLFLPALWVALEFIRGILFSGFPWAVLGYTQYRNPGIIQIADITGSYGVSFVIMMVNFVVYAQLKCIIKKDLDNFRKMLLQTIVTLVIIAGIMSYGFYEIGKEDIGTGLRLSIVQGNIAQEKKWDPAYKEEIMARYEILTKEAAEDGSDLIIWPETAVPGYLDEADISVYLEELVKDTGIPLFAGVVTYEFSREKDYFFNSAVLFSSDGNIKKKYDKIHLVPFGEYVPFEKYITFARDFINVPIGDFTPKEEFTVFDIKSKDGKNYKYGALICFEDIFPYLARDFAREGADFLVNMTNDAWFKESSENLQHAQASVFRAVENRASVIRAANTGFSCYISPKGIIEDAIYDKNAGMYIAGHKTFDLKTSKKDTFYTKYGDLFAYLCLILAGTSLFLIDILNRKSISYANNAVKYKGREA